MIMKQRYNKRARSFLSVKSEGYKSVCVSKKHKKRVKEEGIVLKEVVY